ncbi:hypothetical protein HC928_20405 [bacterium]|nr:hypothetical protein [bacterium]
MSESVNGRLSRAFELIEADQLKEAREILEPLLTSQRDNPDVWWLYAHAIEDIAPAEEALQRVMALDPNYPGAGSLAESIETLKISKVALDGSLDDLDVDDFINDDVMFEGDKSVIQDTSAKAGVQNDADDVEEAASVQQILWRLALPALLIAALVFVFVILNPFGGEDEESEPTPTLAAQVEEEPTVIIAVDTAPIPTNVNLPTATPEAVLSPTSEPTILAASPTLEIENTALPTQPQELTPDGEAVGPGPEDTPDATGVDGLAQIELAVVEAGLSIVDDSGRIESTNLGETVLISVCSELGPALRDAYPVALQAMAGQSEAFEGRAEAVGVTFVNCDDSTLLNALGVDLLSAIAFAQGNINTDTFRALWRPIQ